MSKNSKFAEAISVAIELWNEQRNSRRCVSHLAKRLKCSVQAIYKWRKAGYIASDKLAQVYLFFSEIQGCDAAFWGETPRGYANMLEEANRLQSLELLAKINEICNSYKAADDAKKELLNSLISNPNLLQNIKHL